MGITGDFGKLHEWSDRMDRLADISDRVADAAVPKIHSLVAAEFASKTDPYGAGWRPIKAATHKRGTSSALIRSGELRSSVQVTADGHSIKATVDVPYVQYAAGGGRAVLPEGELPPKWSEALTQEAAKQFDKITGGGK